MAKVKYQSSSPYHDTPQTSWYLLPIKLRTIEGDVSDSLLTIDTKYHNRPDKLAYDLYGSPAYWWVFMVRNLDSIRDPIWGFEAGKQIYAPTKQRLQSLMS